jgi:hypothetical protein
MACQQARLEVVGRTCHYGYPYSSDPVAASATECDRAKSARFECASSTHA